MYGSDGKQDDYTDYRGTYRIENTRQALFDAPRDSIHPFGVTIDNAAEGNFPYMYGAANLTIADDVRMPSYKLSDTYRKLTQ